MADAFSRQGNNEMATDLSNQQMNGKELTLAALSAPVPPQLEEIKASYVTHDHLSSLKEQCAEDKLSSNWSLMEPIDCCYRLNKNSAMFFMSRN